MAIATASYGHETHKGESPNAYYVSGWYSCGLPAFLACYHDGMVEKDPASKFSAPDYERETDAQNKPALQSGNVFGPPAVEGINFCNPQDVLTTEQLQELYDVWLL